LCAQVVYSKQSLSVVGPEFDSVLVSDLSRALSSALDREALYGRVRLVATGLPELFRCRELNVCQFLTTFGLTVLRASS
jgi:hypothetical protein